VMVVMVALPLLLHVVVLILLTVRVAGSSSLKIVP
jgi:hypothetical protein